MCKISVPWPVAALLTWAILTIASALPSRAQSHRAAMRFHTTGLPEFAHEAWQATVRLEHRSWHGGRARPRVSTGSGLILDHDVDRRIVWIATSDHLIRCPGSCRTRLYLQLQGEEDGLTSTTAKRVWNDPRRDLALLRATLPPGADVRVARTDLVATTGSGHEVLAVGFPDLSLLGARHPLAQPLKCFSTGHVLTSVQDFRAEVRSYGSTATADRLEVDQALTHSAALLPGSSGGPLIDSSGRVIGINTGSVTTRNTGSCADRRQDCRVHLAVPIEDLLHQIQELLSNSGAGADPPPSGCGSGCDRR